MYVPKVSMFVCMYVHVGGWLCVWVCVCVGGWEGGRVGGWVGGVGVNQSFIYFQLHKESITGIKQNVA